MTNMVAGNVAPRFSLKALDNREHALDKLLEHGPVVAAFFKISCPVCQFTFPFLERLYKRYGDRAAFLGISQDDFWSTKQFAQEYSVTFPLVLDKEGYPVSNAYGLTNVPTILFVDTDGTVRISCTGFERRALEDIARELSERSKMAFTPLFGPNEIIPDSKPG